ncbi:MAG: FtsW/RodA/SpoVE family cell cycle protein [Muribaculaceae bacterium]|nr:FtsW/RodA/SpoVE family cell cycle protein [Muribaculaceae bacterium]
MPVTKTSTAEKLIISETVDGKKIISKLSRSNSTRDESSKKSRFKSDPYLWGIYVMLLIVGVIELFSASSSEVTSSNVYTPLIRHSIFLGIGFVIVLGLQRIHYGYISRFAWVFALLSLGLLILSSLIGININGAQRALRIAGFTIQPAEMVKLAVVVILATILGRHQRPGDVATPGVVQVALVVIVFSGLTWRNGLTNMLLIMGVSISMFLIGGIKWKKLLVVLGVYAVLGACLVGFKYLSPDTNEFDDLQSGAATEQVKVDRTGTQKGRLARYLAGTNPEDPIDDLNRQVVLSKFAQANGGIFGRGPGNSRETARLPLAFSDYIYSIIIEDTGLVGGIILMAIYLLLLGRAGRIAYRCSRAFPAFLILGCAVLIVFQALVHMAIVTALFPVSGQPLPLISKGGTSVLVMSAAIGIMLSVSRYAVRTGDKKQIVSESYVVPADLHTANATEYNSVE